MSVEAAKSYVDAGGERNGVDQTIYRGTVGSANVMYLPAGFVFYEKVGSIIFAGARVPIILTTDHDRMSALSQELTALAMEDVSLQLMVSACVAAA